MMFMIVFSRHIAVILPNSGSLLTNNAAVIYDGSMDGDLDQNDQTCTCRLGKT